MDTGDHSATSLRYAWLGAGAITLGVGAALASGAGVAHADGTASSPGAKSSHAVSAPRAVPNGQKHASAPVSTVRSAAGTARGHTSPLARVSVPARMTNASARLNPVTNLIAPLMAALTNLFKANTPTPPSNPLGGVVWGVLRGLNTALGFTPRAGKPTVSKPDETTGTVTGTWKFTEPAGLDMTLGFTQATSGVVKVYTDGTFSYTPNLDARLVATASTTDRFTIVANSGIASTRLVITVPVLPITTSPRAHTLIPTSAISIFQVAVSPTGPQAGYIYTINQGSTSPGGTGAVWVVNPINNAVTTKITVGQNPNALAVSPIGPKAGYIYVTNFNDGTVSLINPATNKVTATIPVGFHPLGVAVSPVGPKAGFVYVANANSNTISVIDPTTNTIAATINTAILSSGVPINIPEFVAVSPTGPKAGYVYVANHTVLGAAVPVIDPATNTVSATIPISGVFVKDVAVSPVGPKAGFVYVTSSNADGSGGAVSVIDPATNKVTATINVGTQPGGVAVSPTGPEAGFIYVGSMYNGAEMVSVIDPSTNEIVDQIAGVGANSLAVSPTGPKAGYIYGSWGMLYAIS